jgi:hypothetical protein
MIMLKIGAGASLAILAFAANAHIPASRIPEKGWYGPGHLCEANFTLRVKRGEYIREDVQLEPWYPASDTIKSSEGWYAISTLRDNPAKADRIRRLNSNNLGTIYRLRPTVDSTFSARFVFSPRETAAFPVEIKFFRADRPSSATSDWRIAPQKSYDPAQYETVLNRIDFSNLRQTDCLNR